MRQSWNIVLKILRRRSHQWMCICENLWENNLFVCLQVFDCEPETVCHSLNKFHVIVKSEHRLKSIEPFCICNQMSVTECPH